MGFWDNVLNRVPYPVAMFTPRVEYIGGREDITEAYLGEQLAQHTVAQLWRRQPHLRTVVSFLARNVAQLGLHTFERTSETDRRRDRTSPFAQALAYPDGRMTAYDLIFALVGDLCLYDRAYWYHGPSNSTPSGVMLRRLPPSWVTPISSNLFEVESYAISGEKGQVVNVPANQILDFTGYSPTNPLKGSPTVESLRDTLQEQVEASVYRRQVWQRGGRVSSVLQRPKEAPKWSDAARESFREDWYATYTGRGANAGGTPILEDGMTLQRIDFNAQEQQFVEAARLGLSTVASAFHVNPTMIGQNEGATYSNVREFRRMLYGDTLGPLLAQIESRVNTFLLPMMDMDSSRFYVEFNIAEKLQGSFEEQASVMSTLTGRPIMTANEGRARFNLSKLDDPSADELVTPLNVLVGGQASPTDSGTQNTVPNPQEPKSLPRKEIRLKTRPTENFEEKGAEILDAFFKRQERVVRSHIGAKAAGDDWWAEERWDEELAADLYRFAVATSHSVGRKTLEDIGFRPDEYDVDRTMAWLDEVARRSAKSINEATYEALKTALDADEPGAAVDQTFAGQASRAVVTAGTLVTTLSGFSTHEAAKQVAGDNPATKTWVTGPNPRPAHAAMNGEQVGLDEEFSNGLSWPGDARGGADQVAGCNCDMTISF